MKVAVVDISGTVDEYSLYLAHSLCKMKAEEDDVTLLCQTTHNDEGVKLVRLFSLIPAKYKRSVSKWKRTTKAFETIFNYIRVIIFVWFRRIDVVHFQWFPFLSLGSVEIHVLKAIHRLSPKTKIVYTHHNLYPHDASVKLKLIYKVRLNRIASLIDMVVVHTERTKQDMLKEFGIEAHRISVQYHGIFYPHEQYNKSKRPSEKKKILMYGMQTPYKGTDIFVKSLDLLPEDIKQKLSVEIVGRLKDDYWDTFRTMAEKNHIIVNPERISNKDLYEKITSADYLVYPYKQISQSGALLLGLYFNKIILPSDLPQFIETLEGFQSDWFFESESPESLANLIGRHINGEIDEAAQLNSIRNLNEKYSWDTIAESSLKMYKEVLQNEQS